MQGDLPGKYTQQLKNQPALAIEPTTKKYMIDCCPLLLPGLANNSQQMKSFYQEGELIFQKQTDTGQLRLPKNTSVYNCRNLFPDLYFNMLFRMQSSCQIKECSCLARFQQIIAVPNKSSWGSFHGLMLLKSLLSCLVSCQRPLCLICHETNFTLFTSICQFNYCADEQPEGIKLRVFGNQKRQIYGLPFNYRGRNKGQWLAPKFKDKKCFSLPSYSCKQGDPPLRIHHLLDESVLQNSPHLQTDFSFVYQNSPFSNEPPPFLFY